MAEIPPFVDVLEGYVRRSLLRPKQLKELTDLPLETIKNWLEGRVRRPRDWRDVAKLAQALHLTNHEADRLLRSAGHPAVRELAQRYPDERALLAPWLAASPQFPPLDHSLELLHGLLGDELPPLAPLPAGSWMPLRYNPLFVGRHEELHALGHLLYGGLASIGPLAAATGVGGLGKTQLAVEFVHRYGQFFAGGVYWLSFAERDAIATQVATCGGAGAMNLRPDFATLPLDEQVKFVRAAWLEPMPRLLVFDNCEDEESLRAWLPVSGGCRVLVTSRKTQWEPLLGVQTLALDVLPRRDSLALLLKYRPDLLMDDKTLDAIAAELGDLPLALQLAGRYLGRYRLVATPATYLEELRRAPVLDHRSLSDTASSLEGRANHVGRTFALSYKQIDPTQPTDALALALLARAAQFAPGEPMLRDVLVATLQRGYGNDGRKPQEIEDAVIRLGGLGLLTTEGNGTIRVHRLVSAFVQVASPDQLAQTDVEETLAQLAVEVADATDIPSVLRLQAQLHFAADRALANRSGQAAELAHGLGYHLWLLGRYADAQRYLEQALDLREAGEARDPLAIASSYNLLGLAYQLQSRFSLARTMFEHAIVVWEAHAGPEHEATLDDIHNLGYLNMIMGDYGDAEKLLRRALNARRKLFGLVSPKLMRSLNSIGYLSILQGQYRRAMRYLRLAKAVGKRTLPALHPTLAMTLLLNGRVLYLQGNFVGALSYLHQSVQMWEALFGTELAPIAEAYTWIGRIMDEQGDSAGAWWHLEQALAIDERVVGTVNHDTAFVLAQFGIVARHQGRLAEARTFLERAYSIRLKIFGADHPDTLTTAEELAELAREEALLSGIELQRGE